MLQKIELKCNLVEIDTLTGKVQSSNRFRIAVEDSKSSILGGVYLLAPAIAMFVLFHPSVGFRPAQALSHGDPMAAWAAALVGLVPGYILYKRVITVRSHEWHRIQALKKLSKHYKNEDSASWNEDQSIKLHTTKGSVEVGTLTENALEKMQGRIGDLLMDNTEARSEIKSEADIELLLDKDHVNLAAARMRGDSSLEDKTNQVTIAENKGKSGMDTVLDWIALKLSRKNDKNPQKTDIVSDTNESGQDSDFQQRTVGASEYDSLISNSWHCRTCSTMNSIDTNYCDVCGSSKA